MRVLKAFFTVVLSASFLVACGGDGDNGNSGGGSGTLCAAYGKINANMTYDQVKNIIGYDYNDGKNEYSSSFTMYKWQEGRGTYNPVVFFVAIDESGVIQKTVAGCSGGGGGNDSKNYR